MNTTGFEKLYESQVSLRKARRGSVIVTAMIFAMIVALVAGSFLTIAVHERAMAAVSVEMDSLLNSAEAGIDHAVWCIKKNDWTGWREVGSGDDRYMGERTMTMGDRSNTVTVLVQNYATDPLIYATSNATMYNGNKLSKQVMVRFDRGGGAAGGLISKGNINLSGNFEVFSYDSSAGTANPLFRNDEATVASISKTADAMTLDQNVDIYGYAGTGEYDPVIVGTGVQVHGDDTPLGTSIDDDRIATDFTFDFPEVIEPDFTGSQTSPNGPFNISYMAPNGSLQTYKLYTIGTNGSSTKYDLGDVQLTGKVIYYFMGDVTLKVEGFSTSGQAYVIIDEDASLEMYASGNVNMAGQGVNNKSNVPDNFKAFGTADAGAGQTLSLAGNGDTAGVFYFPNADAKIAGNGNYSGSLVAGSITGTGMGWFAYDEQLADGGGQQIAGIEEWHELVGASEKLDIAAYVKANP